MDVYGMVITIVGGLALFLFGMRLMSEGLQKVAGPKMKSVLSAMTGNRFAGVGTGLGVTCAVQSSSATTVMLVSFVSAGLITLEQSVGVVMGANIGTTLTGWLVALVGFKVKIAAMALPAIAIGFAPRLVGARKAADWGEVVLGFGILFLGLDFMKESVGQLRESETIISWMASTSSAQLHWRLMSVGIGAMVTLVVQSSSATMAITMTLAAQGLIDLPTACALVLGENIGTTVTANLAAFGASTSAKRTAFVHFMFNVTGAIWAVVLFNPFYELVIAIVPGGHLADGALSEVGIASRLAAFHTCFNVINTLLFLGFTKQLAKISTFVIKDKASRDQFSLKYLHPSVIDSPPMAIHAAKSELARMLHEVESMVSRVLMLIVAPNQKMGKVAEAIQASEQTVDFLEKEITEYLVRIGQLETSLEQSHEVTAMVSAVGDVERMGDHCESLVKLLMRRYDEKLEFTDRSVKELSDIGEQVSQFVALLGKNMIDTSRSILPKAKQHEELINDMRGKMRRDHVKRLQAGECEVSAGLIFIDMLTSFEKIGDHAFNVAEMLAGER